MEIRYNVDTEYQGNCSELEETLNLPEGKCLFKLFVNKPDNCKILINDVEQDSIIVDSLEVVHWKITKEGYKSSIGEFQVLNSIAFSISLIKEKPKKIREPYIKWSINDKLGYDVEILDLSDQGESDLPLPSPEGRDDSYLYTIGGNLFWKKIKPENIFSPKAIDNNKFVKFDSSKGFVFDEILPDYSNLEKDSVLKVKNNELFWDEDRNLPEYPVEEVGNVQDYTISYLNGNLKWKLNPFQLPLLPDETYSQGKDYILTCNNSEVFWKLKDTDLKWGNIQGSLNAQEDLSNRFTENENAISVLNTSVENNTNWINNFGVEADGFEFVDGKIKYQDGFVFPDGREVASLIELVNALRDRYATFEYYTRKQLEVRLTSPDYAQIENVTLDNDGFFINMKKRYLRIESDTVGDELTVYKPLFDSNSGTIIGVDRQNPITTIYRNVSGSGDIRVIELTVGFYYKASNKNSMHLQFIGELPYGDFPG